MRNKALEIFGKTLMQDVRDAAIESCVMILDGRMKDRDSKVLREQMRALQFTPEQHDLLFRLIPQIVDECIHHLLWRLEDPDPIQVAVKAADCNEPDISAVSDGLAGEVFTEDGWIAKFSKYPEGCNPRDVESPEPEPAPASRGSIGSTDAIAVNCEDCAVDGGYKYHLPRVECDRCHSTWAQPFAACPAFDFDFYTESVHDANRTVSPDELERIGRPILDAIGRSIWLPPGAGLGPFYGTAPGPLTDFVDACAAILISRRAFELLRADGLELRAGPAHLRRRGRRLETHLALHVEEVPMLAPTTFHEMGMTYCPRCGEYRMWKPLAHLKGTCYLRKNWPSNTPTVCVREICDLLVTPEFRESVERHGLTGIQFEVCGHLV